MGVLIQILGINNDAEDPLKIRAEMLNKRHPRLARRISSKLQGSILGQLLLQSNVDVELLVSSSPMAAPGQGQAGGNFVGVAEVDHAQVLLCVGVA